MTYKVKYALDISQSHKSLKINQSTTRIHSQIMYVFKHIDEGGGMSGSGRGRLTLAFIFFGERKSIRLWSAAVDC